MSLVAKTVAFSIISLVSVFVIGVIASVACHPYTTFDGVTTFQLTMVVCWLVYIADNTTPKSN